ncbi:MAG: LytTR family DNA-binding domain-containing protein, partial [Candidatus Saccharibacteria bacterium]|nr:LytTR family DNA-binding domain-containing protein [Candidatus Saccharibacteria bacterium]
TFIANKLKREKSTISFHYDREYIRLVCRDIYYCTSEHNGSVIYTQTSTYHTRMTLSELEEQLDSVSFCRINRGCVINLAYVQSVKGNQINFEGQELPFYIGKSYQDAFNRALVYYEEREYFG